MLEAVPFTAFVFTLLCERRPQLQTALAVNLSPVRPSGAVMELSWSCRGAGLK